MAATSASADMPPLLAWAGRGATYRAFTQALADYRAAVERGNTQRIHATRERLERAQHDRLRCGA